MNILIVGNGFDLAHGLPTKYADFLKFIDFFYKHKAQESSRLELIAGEDIHCYKYFTDLFNSKQDSEFDQYLYDQSRKTIHELSDLCKDNAWIKYFSEVYKSREQKGKDGWIDFESEISLIIQTFNSVSRDIQETIQKGGVGTVLSQRQLNVLALFVEKMDSSSGMATHVWKKEEIDFWKQKLLEDLNKLTRALEIYLSDYISNFMLGNGLPDIKNLPYLDKILSFNYTCAYQRIYGEHPFLEFDYVHGKADLRNDIQSTNMVLGIDEYLEGDARDKDLEFIEFKKFFQRIHKETGGEHFSVSLTYFLQNKTVLPVCKRQCDLCVLFPDRYFLFRRIQHISIWSRRFPHKIRSVLQPVFERLSIFIRFQHSCYRLIRKQHCSVYRCNCSARNHLICCTRKCFP